MIFKHNGSTGQESFKSEQVGEKASEIGVGTQMEGNLWSLASQQGTGDCEQYNTEANGL